MIISLESVTNFLITIALDHAAKLLQLRLGRVPEVLTFGQFDLLVNRGLDRLLGLEFPVHYTEDNHTQAFTILQATTIGNDSNAFLIFIPYVSTQKYTLTKLIRFPLMGNESTNMIINVPSYIAIGQANATNKHEYIEFSDSDMQSCIAAREALVICQTSFVWPNHDYQTCALQLIKSFPPTQCRYETTYIPNGVFTKLISQNWYIFLEKPISATLICPDDTGSNPSIHTYVGTYILHPPCALYSDKFQLSTIRVTHSAFTSGRMKKIPNFITETTHFIKNRRSK